MNHTSIARYAALAAAGLVIVGSVTEASAQSRGERLANICLYPVRMMTSGVQACVTNSGCGYGKTCQSGRCLPDPVLARREADQKRLDELEADDAPEQEESEAGEDQTTRQECDMDRRCRIERLKRTNRARRYTMMVEQEQRAKQISESYDRAEFEAIRRQADPLSLDLTVDTLAAGFTLGYVIAGGHIRLAPMILWGSDNSYETTTANGVTLETELFLDWTDISLTAEYLWRTGWWTPYLSGGISYITGDNNGYAYSYDDFGLGGNQSAGGEIEIHGVRVGAGFDMQFGIGFRARLGVVGRYALYTQVRNGPGSYDQAANEALDAWFSDTYFVQPELSFGWAF